MRSAIEIPSEEEQRILWRSMWLSSLQAFADSETQQTRWIDPEERNPAYTFVECMCGYFDDAFMVDESAYQRKLARGHVTKAEIDAVLEFHRLAESYRSPRDDDYDIRAILADPAWQQVVIAAKESQQRLISLLTDERERLLLLQPRTWVQDGDTFTDESVGSAYVRACDDSP